MMNVKVGNYLICKKNYYINRGFFSKPKFIKNKSYRIENIIDPFSNYGCPVGPQGIVGPQGQIAPVGPQGQIATTSTTTTTTTTSTYTTTICNDITYVINGIHLYEWTIEEYFYSKQEERFIKLKKIKK